MIKKITYLLLISSISILFLTGFTSPKCSQINTCSITCNSSNILSTKYYNSYIFYDSDCRYLDKSELYGLSSWELRIARNEIYARHGRLFKDQALQQYFDSCSWYTGYISPNSFNDNVLNEYEVYNIKLIKSVENNSNSSSTAPYYSDCYIFYDSDCRYLDKSELYGLSSWELRLARNEIYARHGRLFKDKNLQQYFNSCSWYNGYISPDSFNDNVLNKYEVYNIKLIKSFE